MYGWYKLKAESETEMQISYSLGKNKACDGLIVYDKSNKEIRLVRLSAGSDEWISNWLAGHIANQIVKGEVSTEQKMIAVG